MTCHVQNKTSFAIVQRLWYKQDTHADGWTMTGDAYDRVAVILGALSWTPYMTVDDLVEIHRLPRTNTCNLLEKMVSMGDVAYLPHALLRRNASRRYCLTGNGVEALADMMEVETSTLLHRRGATYKGLAYLRKRLDSLACAYAAVAAIARRYDGAGISTTVYTRGPLDAAVQFPGPPNGTNDPFWVGIMAVRPDIGKALESRLSEYQHERPRIRQQH